MALAMVLYMLAAALAHGDDDYESSGHHDDGHHHGGNEGAVWFWVFLAIGGLVLLFVCLGVGWYGGSRRREYYIRHPDGSILGYAETTKSESRARRVGRRRGAVVGYALGNDAAESRATPPF